MRVFISSPIYGLEEEREAVRDVLSPAHEVVMSDHFGTRSESSLDACLEEVSSSDLVVLVLGGRYGSPAHASGLSYTEHEYERARLSKLPVLPYFQDESVYRARDEDEMSQGRLKEPRQRLREIHCTDHTQFLTSDELAKRVRRDVEGYLCRAAGRIDQTTLHFDRDMDYAINIAASEQLCALGFSVLVADLEMLPYADYPSREHRRLSRKVLDLVESGRKQGYPVSLLNKVPLPTTPDRDLAAERVRLARMCRGEVVCIAYREAQAPAATELVGDSNRVVLFYRSARGDAPPGILEAEFAFSEEEVDSCGLLGRLRSYVFHAGDSRLREFLAKS